MQKMLSVLLSGILAVLFVGCQKTISGSDIYTFPENITQIKGCYFSCDPEKEFVIGSEKHHPDDTSVISVEEWFYSLKLEACEQPEAADGGAYYEFIINEETAFGYQYRGGDEAYVLISDSWYKVKNHSIPPVPVH